MGGCLSKKESISTAPSAIVKNPLPDPPTKPPNKLEEEKKKTPTTTTTTTSNASATTAAAGQMEETVKKKEVFVIKQRRSHERRPSEEKIKNFISTPSKDEQSQSSAVSGDVVGVVNGGGGSNGKISGAPVRTSSCTKEEVDAILIQCGRLSRSSSGNRKYSGSKRSYDFDHDSNEKGDDAVADAANGNGENRQRHHSRSSHRRTPSREKDVDSSKRSGSRDRYSSSREEERGGRSNGGSGSRRVSRSPGRRSETPSSGATNGTGDKSQRPGKMVSVPASVANTRGDKSIAAAAGGGESGMAAGVKRVSVKRSVEAGHRTTAASPRSQSPANIRASSNNENNNAHHQNQPGHTLSRSSSRKAEQSPYRRNPMTEIDDNCQKNETLKSQQDQKVSQKSKETEPLTKKTSHLQSQQKSDVRHNKATELAQVTNNNVGDHPVEEAKGGLSQKASRVTAGGATESQKPQGITRTRSSRKSRDLDINLGLDPDTVLNPTSYASLLLEDIQNFHQQKSTTAAAAAPTAFSLPACVTKACSILDAVADLNSCTSSNLSSTFSNEDRSCFETDRSSNNNKNFNRSANAVPFNPLGKKKLEVKDPFMESEIVADDDLMEPSLHKYITVRRGVNVIPGVETEMEQQESSGSNSYMGQHWVSSSSSWEPNSADSTDRWTSRSNTGDEEEPTLQVSEKLQKQQQTISATPIRRKRETTDHHRQVGAGGRGQMTIPIAAASM